MLIKFDNIYKIRNTPVPKLLDIEVKAGIDDYFTNGKDTRISLLPYNYLPGGSKCTGYLNKDIFNYACDILDIIEKECFFDETKNEEMEIAERYKLFLKEKASSTEVVNNFFLPHKRKLTFKYVNNVTTNNLFNIEIIKVYDDIKLPCNIINEHKFLLLFGSKAMESSCLNLDFNKTTLSLNNFDLILSLADFINILYKIFFYYYSQSVRDLTIAGAMHYVNYYYNRNIKETECWDNKYNKYFSSIPLNLNNSSLNYFKLQFDLSKISDITKDYIHTNTIEVINTIDYITFNLIDKDSGEVFITKTPEREFGWSYNENIFRITGYIPYLKDGKSEAVSLSLYADLKSNTTLTESINVLAYSPSPYLQYMRLYLFNDSLQKDIKYENVFIDMPIKELIDKDLIAIKCDVCYYTNNRKTEISYYNLIDKKIPKYKRDYLYKIFCALCHELNLSPLYVKDKIIVDFLKYYNNDLIGG